MARHSSTADHTLTSLTSLLCFFLQEKKNLFMMNIVAELLRIFFIIGSLEARPVIEDLVKYEIKESFHV